MLYQISNQNLIVQIESLGAELKSAKYYGTEYIHDSNPEFWSRSAPILFPNIGTIKGGSCKINGEDYKMKKHGFLRDREFTVTHSETSSITFTYNSTDEDSTIYPFKFQANIKFQIHGNVLKSYIVIKNLSDNTMLFNLGLHPAFKVPLFENEKFEDYKFKFIEPVTCDSPTVNLTDGTIDYNTPYRSFNNLSTLPLNYDDYSNDALIFSNLETKQIKLLNKDESHGIWFEFNNFPLLGIWTPNNVKANFICIEPWIGGADPIDHSGIFEDKAHLVSLPKDEMKLFSYQIRFF